MQGGRKNFFFPLPFLLACWRWLARCKIRKCGAGGNERACCFCRRCGCHMSSQSFGRGFVPPQPTTTQKVRHNVPVHVHTTIASSQVHAQCCCRPFIHPKFFFENFQLPHATFRAWSEIAKQRRLAMSLLQVLRKCKTTQTLFNCLDTVRRLSTGGHAPAGGSSWFGSATGAETRAASRPKASPANAQMAQSQCPEVNGPSWLGTKVQVPSVGDGLPSKKPSDRKSQGSPHANPLPT